MPTLPRMEEQNYYRFNAAWWQTQLGGGYSSRKGFSWEIGFANFI
jgi:hypothetical protein